MPLLQVMPVPQGLSSANGMQELLPRMLAATSAATHVSVMPEQASVQQQEAVQGSYQRLQNMMLAGDM